MFCATYVFRWEHKVWFLCYFYKSQYLLSYRSICGKKNHVLSKDNVRSHHAPWRGNGFFCLFCFVFHISTPNSNSEQQTAQINLNVAFKWHHLKNIKVSTLQKMIISKHIEVWEAIDAEFIEENSKSIRSRTHFQRNWEDSVVKTMNIQLHWWPQKYNLNLHSNIVLHGREPSFFKKMEMTKIGDNGTLMHYRYACHDIWTWRWVVFEEKCLFLY